MVVKAGICVAYDWEFLKLSLPVLYPHVSSICLSVDSELKSWNGNTFQMDWQGLDQLVKHVDTDQKIFLLKEPFYNAGRTPIANECYQRKRMAEVLGSADWYVQIDTDEIFINAKQFIANLKKHAPSKRPVNIHGIWANLIKKTDKGFVYSVLKTPPLATNQPVYEYGRTNGHFNVYTNSFLAHITWARDQEEVKYKLMNWGHSHEFNGVSFYNMWQAIDDYNWRYLRDFHPMSKGNMDRLYFLAAANVNEFIRKFDETPHQLSATDIAANNIWISRLRKVLKRTK
jgi:hypothetical protein